MLRVVLLVSFLILEMVWLMLYQSLKVSPCLTQFKESTLLEGNFIIRFNLQNSEFSLRDITEHLQLLLRKSGNYFYTSSEKEIVRSIKESLCYISFDPNKEEEVLDAEKSSKPQATKFKLPDGNTIEVRLFLCFLQIKKDLFIVC